MNLSGWYSKRIDMTHRLVYRFNKEKNILEILSCKSHYDF
ncbi:MAG: type II toxin-antitoxin system YoeB family toxin [Desulfobacteraceae bacterium]|nr:type II toxin-antitoxin system YoeB family toxin [Desulfobacteraceae bacterium]